MKVNRSQLIEGCILARDIKLISNQPLMRKKTVLTQDLIDILKVFLVKDVYVEDKLVNGQRFQPSEIEEDELEENVKEERFIDIYLDVVQQYKKHYHQWRTGYSANVAAVRNFLVPLFEKIVEHPEHILMLHHYSKKEDYIYHHAVSVSLLAAFLANKMNYSMDEWIEVGLAGALADIGMTQIPPEILMKNANLTAMEYEKVKKHPIFSYKMLKGLKGVTEPMLIAVLQHHEREDGSGYPLGTTAKKIHAYSQIIAVADVYHAMTSERYYRSKQSPYKVLESISKDQFGKFHHNVVQIMLNGLLNFSVGTSVRLTNGEEAEIVFVDQQTPTRPMVKLKSNGEIISLLANTQLHIEEVLT